MVDVCAAELLSALFRWLVPCFSCSSPRPGSDLRHTSPWPRAQELVQLPIGSLGLPVVFFALAAALVVPEDPPRRALPVGGGEHPVFILPLLGVPLAHHAAVEGHLALLPDRANVLDLLDLL